MIKVKVIGEKRVNGKKCFLLLLADLVSNDLPSGQQEEIVNKRQKTIDSREKRRKFSSWME